MQGNLHDPSPTFRSSYKIVSVLLFFAPKAFVLVMTSVVALNVLIVYELHFAIPIHNVILSTINLCPDAHKILETLIPLYSFLEACFC